MRLQTFAISHPTLGSRKIREIHRAIAIAKFLLGAGVAPGSATWKRYESELTIR